MIGIRNTVFGADIRQKPIIVLETKVRALKQNQKSALTCLIKDDIALIAIFHKMSDQSKKYVKTKIRSHMPRQLYAVVDKVVENIYANKLIQPKTLTDEVYGFLTHRFSQCLSQSGLNRNRRRLFRCRQFLHWTTNIHRKKTLGWSIARSTKKFSVALKKSQFKSSLVADVYSLKQPFSEFWYNVIINCALNVRK